LTFAVMLAVGVVISTLTARLRDRLRASQEFERRTAALFQLTRQMSEIAGAEFLIGVAGRQLADIFDGEVVIYEKDAAGPIVLRYGENTAIPKDERNAAVAQWVADHGEVAGVGTDTLPAASALFVPLSGSGGPVGAVGVKARDSERFADPEQRRFLQTCASMIALSLERDRSVLEAHKSEVRVQQEQVRNSLLNSVSHDLRTPLAAIAGAGAALLTAQIPEDVRRELVQSIVDESRHLSRLVDNLLDVTRLEAGGLALNKQWHVLEEIIGSARNRLRAELARHGVRVAIPDGFPLIHVDGLLLEQVFVNLLDNAARYTREGSRIEIVAEQKADAVVLHVRDNGPGLPQGAERRVFEKFFRGISAGTPDQRRGVGLGLTICDGIMKAHSGTIEARNQPEGGAEFVLTLPCRESSPNVPVEE
jgi:two-component system, OmpR family, sensor histidine kinase KdpD